MRSRSSRGSSADQPPKGPKASVLADLAGPVVITSSQQTVALQGMGGLGKSVLAAVFARSCPVRRAFGDGVIWVRVGQQGDVVAALRLVGQALGDQHPSGYLDVAAGKGRLMELLADRVCLLVLDDLWDVTHAEAVSASADETLIVWDLVRGIAERTLNGHSGYVSAVAITPDSRRVISGSHDRTARVWDLESGEIVQVLGGHSGPVEAVAITPDGRRAVTASAATLKVWNLEQGTLLWSLEGHAEGHDGNVNAIALTPDGRQVVSASNDATLVVWNLEQGTAQRTLGPPAWRLREEMTTPDGRPGEMYKDRKGGETRVVIDLDTRQELYRLPGHTARIWAVAVTADSQRAVSASEDTTLRVWDLASGAELHVLRGHTSQVVAVAVTQDGRYAVSGSVDKTVCSWDLTTGQLLRTFEGHGSDVDQLAVTPDGSRVISGSIDETIRVWDLDKDSEELILRAHTDSVRAVAVTPDSRYAVSGSNDKTLRLWDLAASSRPDGNRHLGRVNALAITADGRRAVTAAGGGSPLAAPDNTLKVWDTRTGTEVTTLKGQVSAFHGHRAYVTRALLLRSGRQLVSASLDGTVRLWNVHNTREVATFAAESPVYSCAASADGRVMVAGEESGRVHFLSIEGSS
jgi:WD40 repeat protein